MSIRSKHCLSFVCAVAAATWLVGVSSCSTKSDSLGVAGGKDAAPVDAITASDTARAVDGAIPVDSLMAVDGATPVDAVVPVDTIGPVDGVVAMDTARPVDAAIVPDAPVSIDTRPETNPVTCNYNGTLYTVGQVVTLSACTTCLCLTTGSLGNCTGACPPDAGLDAARDAALADALLSTDTTMSSDASALASLCTSTGGTITQGLCCGGASDFPNLCLTGACGCAPTSSHTVNKCICPGTSCYDPAEGCTGPAGVCTIGMDQTCNDSPIVSAIYGRCVSQGRCVCTGGRTLLASGKCG